MPYVVAIAIVWLSVSAVAGAAVGMLMRSVDRDSPASPRRLPATDSPGDNVLDARHLFAAACEAAAQ